MKKISNCLAWIYLGLIIPLMISVLVVNWMAMGLMHRQEEKILASGVESYAGQLDKTLLGIEEHLVTFCTLEPDIDNMQYLASETERVMATQRVLTRLKQDVLIYPLMRAEFLYTAHLDSCITIRENGLSFEESQQVNAMVANLCSTLKIHPEELRTGRWQAYVWEADTFLLYVAGSEEASLGYLIAAEDILSGMPQTSPREWTGQLLCDGNVAAELICGTDARKKGAVCLKCEVGNIGLALQAWMKHTSLYDSPHLQRAMLMLVPLAVLVTLCVLFIFISHKIVLPVNQTVDVMKQAGAGDLSVRVSTKGMLEELAMIGNTLNEMLEKITMLQDNEKEMIREMEKSSLRNLQLQINPHFLGNCLNMVYNASLCGSNCLVLDLTTHLRRYFVRMAQMEKDFIPLSDELEFTEDFLEIQKLRFPAMDYEILVPEYLKQIPVPPSVVKSFAENAAQYSRTEREDIRIRIEIALSGETDEPLLVAVISDNGPGFPQQVLSALETGGTLYFDGRTHIGITNVKKRLELLYGTHA